MIDKIPSRVHVIIVDDVCRFALHLSRYLGFELGFRIGNTAWHGSISDSEAPQYEGKEEDKPKPPFFHYRKNPFWSKMIRKGVFDSREHEEVVSDSGLVYLWWAPAVSENEKKIHDEIGGWKGALKKISARIKEIEGDKDDYRVISVIDVRGRDDEKQPEKKRYFPSEVITTLMTEGLIDEKEVSKPNSPYVSNRIHIVSSYVVGQIKKPEKWTGGFPASLPIRAKSPENFRLIQNKVKDLLYEGISLSAPESANPINQDDDQKNNEQVYHFLVTGAGFELKGQKGLSPETFGISQTWDLLKNMGRPFREVASDSTPKLAEDEYRDKFELERELDLQLQKLDDGYPTLIQKDDSDNQFKKEYKKIEVRKNLDTWWDLVTWQVIQRKVNPLLEAEDGKNYVKRNRLDREVDSIETEYRMRDAFRKIILGYDWGHLRHNLIAAQLNWDAWFTTNYTRFADRSVQLMEHLNEIWTGVNTDPFQGLWRFGQINGLEAEKKGVDSSEATEDTDEDNLQFDQKGQRTLWRVIGTSNAAERLQTGHLHKPAYDLKVHRRYLFKLHGDIGQLHTMAITGYDKEPYTPLSMAIDSMDKIYSAAQHFLSQKVFDQDDEPNDENQTQIDKPRKKVRIVWHVVGHGLGDKLLTGLMKTKADEVEYILVSPRGGKDMYANLRRENMIKTCSSVNGVKATASEYMSRLLLLDRGKSLPKVNELNRYFDEDSLLTKDQLEEKIKTKS